MLRELFLALLISLASAQFEWDKPCFDECFCNDVARYITCYQPPAPSAFIDLSFTRTNRTFVKLFLVDYVRLPGASFRDVAFNVNGTPSSPSQVLISLKSPRQIDSDAFRLAQASSFDNKLNRLARRVLRGAARDQVCQSC